MPKSCHTLIIGGGIVGLTIARELLSRGVEDITIIDKEPELALHASGRNSGVLHAGIYYPEATLKARFCLQGSQRMKAFCQEHDLPLNNCKKVIVTRNEAELPTLRTLFERATNNGAKVELIDPQQMAEIEPHAKTTQKALLSHYTSVTSPKNVCAKLESLLRESGKVSIITNCAFVSRQDDTHVNTTQGLIEFKHMINAAGSFADKVAHAFDVGKHCSLIPFKGIYYKLKPEYAHLVNGNIYPVPNIQNPFLGVHFTKSIAGDVYLGPTAIPALGRENYGILKGLDREAFKFLWEDMKLFFSNKKFRQVALTEPQKYLKSRFFNDAKKLVKELKPEWMTHSPKVGIRPQCVNWKTKELEMDFMVLKGLNSTHVVNAISPAFTCSMAFAEFVVDEFVQ